MRNLTPLSTALFVCLACDAIAAETKAVPGQLNLPAHGLSVSLDTGNVSRHGISGQCVETVSRSSGNSLVVTRTPGDDQPTITVNGVTRELNTDRIGRARIGGLRLSPDASLVHLRTWKTGQKQIELLLDGQVQLSWKRGTSVKLLRANEKDLYLLVAASGAPAQLQKFQRISDGSVVQTPEPFLDFEGCQIDRLRLISNVAWSKMACDAGRGSGIFKTPLKQGEIGRSLFSDDRAEFIALPRPDSNKRAVPVAVVTGSPAALQFFYAVTGLLLSQTGEVRACSSDAEGLQSWNQSYRLRALSLLFRKTQAPIFAALARKSLKLTLASRDKGTNQSTKSCGWSSKIYSRGDGSGLKLMINQAVIANALTAGCEDLADNCPTAIQSEIQKSNRCLAQLFEENFDEANNLYRISKDIDFRFSGKIAPWNWQISFAALLNNLPDPHLKSRAKEMVQNFQNEWSQNDKGSLWRYWPEAYYLDKGFSEEQIGEERFEDTGHAGISLLSLIQFEDAFSPKLIRSVQDRVTHLLSFGELPPRDLDGQGPRDARWYVSGGWADFASQALRKAYAAPVPSRNSADTIYAYARLFDPAAAFDLKMDVYLCVEECRFDREFSFDNWQSFMTSNPLFLVHDTAVKVKLATPSTTTMNQLNIQNQ
ncbi:hypothetical protein LP7551_02828 [Roseibium album]|nr:hypothetical protein LP7551_02828 [Roseibium album]